MTNSIRRDDEAHRESEDPRRATSLTDRSRRVDRRTNRRARFRAGQGFYRRLFATIIVAILGSIAVAGVIPGLDLLSRAPAVSRQSSVRAESMPSSYNASTIPTTIAQPATNAGPTGSVTTQPFSTSTTVYVHPIADPVRIVIPSIEVDATIVKVGVQSDGMMEVPDFGYAGWFRVGPAPGEPGPSVVVGHVDTKTGPDVFYHLEELEPGDLVQISDKNGDTATFAVDSSETVLKTELPTERIWINTQEPLIRLITCGGDFDRATGHYRSNTIVYGHLVE